MGVAMRKFKKRGMDCLICHTNILKKEVGYTIDLCPKIFHFECIEEQLALNSKCPHCRKKIL